MSSKSGQGAELLGGVVTMPYTYIPASGRTAGIPGCEDDQQRDAHAAGRHRVPHCVVANSSLATGAWLVPPCPAGCSCAGAGIGEKRLQTRDQWAYCSRAFIFAGGTDGRDPHSCYRREHGWALL